MNKCNLKIKTIIFYTIIVLCLVNAVIVHAYERKDHDKIMQKVLLGENKEFGLSEQSKNNLKALKYASYLCIDQFNGEGEKELNSLRNEIKVKDIIEKIDEIDIKGNFFKYEDGTPATHRICTHRGWDFKYQHVKINSDTNVYMDEGWEKRKAILVNTCKKLFEFNIFSNKKCDAFCSLIYYIHLIGDYEEINDAMKYEKYRANSKAYPGMMPLYKNNDDNNIINEVENDCEILFSSQRNSDDYKNLMDEIKIIKKRLDNESRYEEFYKICDDLIDAIMSKYIPKLLRNEKFFAAKFNY